MTQYGNIAVSIVRLVFNLEPVAKGRPRIGKGVAYTPHKTLCYERSLRSLGFVQMRDAGLNMLPEGLPLCVACDFFVTRPTAAKKRIYPHVKPDLDNYAKAVLDALNATVWFDDSQIVDLRLSKRYAEAGMARVEVTITTAETIVP